METHLEGVGVNQSILFVEAYPATSLLGEILILILDAHVSLREVTEIIFKVHTIHVQHSSQQLTLHLVDVLIKGIAVEEAALLASVCMEITIHNEVILGL